MWFTEFGKPKQLLTRGGAILGNAASTMNVHIFSSHPGRRSRLLVYSQFAAIIRSEGSAYAGLLPTLVDGVKGMQFIVASVQSSQNDGKWIRLSDV